MHWRIGQGQNLLAGKTTVSKLEDDTFFSEFFASPLINGFLELLEKLYCSCTVKNGWMTWNLWSLMSLTLQKTLTFPVQPRRYGRSRVYCQTSIRRGATDPSSNEVQSEIGFHWNGRPLHAFEKACLPL